MQGLLTFIQDLGYMAHGLCLMWEPWLIALFVGSDLLIFAAYFLIPVALLRVLKARPDVQLGGLPRLFAAFILLCGLTHLVSVVTLWVPIYEVQGAFKLATALVSMATVAALFPLIPKIVALPSPAVLGAANDRLSEEIEAHEDALRQLRRARSRLEDKVAERTQALERTNEELNIVLSEAGNRAANLKKLMEALARRTASETTDIADFLDRFQSRISAVVEASDALTRCDGTLPETMQELTEAQLSAYIAAYPGSIRISGENRQLSQVAARQIGLALNELVTNAVKHGALRDAEGTIRINWSRYRGWPDGEERFQMHWTETLSPAVRKELEERDLLQGGRVGFGTRVLSLSVPRRLNGRAEIDFLAEGLSYALDLPLDCVSCSGADLCGLDYPLRPVRGDPPEAPAEFPQAHAEPAKVERQRRSA